MWCFGHARTVGVKDEKSRQKGTDEGGEDVWRMGEDRKLLEVVEKGGIGDGEEAMHDPGGRLTGLCPRQCNKGRGNQKMLS